MTTPKVKPNRPNPPPKENIGANYGQLGWISLGLIIAAAWFIFMYNWGTITGPMNQLENGNYLRTEVSFDLIPRLPDTLAESYDIRRDQQLARINAYGQSETLGNVTVPIDVAMELLLEEGLPTRDSDATADDAATSEEETTDSTDDADASDETDDSTDDSDE